MLLQVRTREPLTMPKPFQRSCSGRNDDEKGAWVGFYFWGLRAELGTGEAESCLLYFTHVGAARKEG